MGTPSWSWSWLRPRHDEAPGAEQGPILRAALEKKKHQTCKTCIKTSLREASGLQLTQDGKLYEKAKSEPGKKGGEANAMGYTHVKDRVSKPMSGEVATLYSLRVRQSFLQLQDTGFQYSTHFRGEYPTTKLPALEPGSGFDVCIAQAGNAGLSAFNMGAVAILGTYVDRVLSEQNRDENSDYEFEVGSHESEVVYVDAAQEGNWTRFLNLPSNEDKANVVAMSNATEIEHYAPSALITFIKSLGEHEAVLMVKGDRRILPGQQLIMFYGEDYRREMYKKDRISRNILDEAAEVRLGTPPKERVTLERGEFSSEEFDLMNTPVRNFPDDLKRDRQFVLAAVAQDGQGALFAYQLALQFADDSLKRDKDVVPAAVAQNGYARQFADVSLKRDEDFSESH